jgi:prepilin-type processing-associated H-X9-DG protein
MDAFLGTTFTWGVGQPGLSPQEQTGSWAYAILPFIEQEGMYQSRDWSLPSGLYNCPSRRPPTAFVPVDDQYGDYFGGGWVWGNTDYGGNAYVVANRPKCLSLTDITDGSSNTILIGEKALNPTIYNMRSSWYWDEPFFVGGSGGTQRGLGPIADDGTLIVQDNINMGDAFRYNWGAVHPGGAQFLFADGSVRLVAFGTPAGTVVALMTPSGGEVVTD